jgi:CMP-2-keto-3-deoxyoctulosonic acid synthetase
MLEFYVASEQTPLECAENPEQLGFLERGVQIQTVRISRPASAFWEINNPEDIAPVKRALREAC